MTFILKYCYTMRVVASLADALLARHAIFLLPLGRKDCVTSQKSVCEGGYNSHSEGGYEGELIPKSKLATVKTFEC